MMGALSARARRAFTRFTRNERVRAVIFPWLQRSPAAAMLVLRITRAIKGGVDLDAPISQVPVPGRLTELTEPARQVLADLQRHCAAAPRDAEPR